MAAKLYKATANFPSLGDDSRQEVMVEAGGWAAAMGLAARKLKALAPLKRKQIKICSIELQLMDGGVRNRSRLPRAAPAPPKNRLSNVAAFPRNVPRNLRQCCGQCCGDSRTSPLQRFTSPHCGDHVSSDDAMHSAPPAGCSGRQIPVQRVR